MRIDIHHHAAADPEATRRDLRILGLLLRLERFMIDITKILAAVAREKTESASLRALLAAKDQIIADGAAKLQAAIAAGGDPAVIAQVQADLDQAAKDLDTDSAAADALAANVPAQPAAA